MLEELQPLTLPEVARQLDLDPFEVVRLLVSGDAMPRGAMVVEPARLTRLRELGGLEGGWWEGVVLPDDDDPRLQRIRGAMRQLISRGHVGAANGTRVDNIWRGLSRPEQTLLDDAVLALADNGLIGLSSTPRGRMVFAQESSLPQLKAFVDGGETPAALAEFLEE